MTKDEFVSLERGDIVRNRGMVHSYVVTCNFAGRVTAVRTMDITNPDEWELIKKREPKDDSHD